jgi:hypothetical protein
LPIGSSHSVLEAFATPRLTPRAQEAFALGGSRVSGRGRKTDYGTVILHWLLVGALSVAIVTGLRIAGEVPDRTWINVLDFVLPKAAVWTAHIQAAVMLVAVAIAYAVYVSLASLGRRVRFDRVRLLGLFGRSEARWGSFNVALYWIFYLTLLAELATGGLLYFGYGNSAVASIHWIGMWTILGYVILHVPTQWMLGGAPQLLRILRPSQLIPPPPPLEVADVLALLDEAGNVTAAPRHPVDAEPAPYDDRPIPAPRLQPQAGHRPTGQRPVPSHVHDSERRHRAESTDKRVQARRRGSVVQANPFVVAASVAIVSVTFMMTVDREVVDTLRIHKVGAAEIPTIDGEASDPVWRRVAPIFVLTEQGGNFDGKGETTVSIRAVHDGVWSYFLFIWDDPTRSLKQLPLTKTENGWRLLHNGYDVGDERSYNEDKFSVLLTKNDVILAGDRTFHAGSASVPGAPRTLSGRGLHYTTEEGAFVDVWLWKATSTGPAGYMDDDHFGPAQKPTDAQLESKAPYRGGFAADPGTSGYLDNFAERPPDAYEQAILPRRLPKDFRATMSALGQIDLDPNHGESEGARWFMTDEDSVPYSKGLDDKIPVGTIIPGVILSGTFSGDRADVRCAARWAAGRWALEVARRLETSSRYDTSIGNGTFMRVAAFDHAQIRHTRHVRPIRLELK